MINPRAASLSNTRPVDGRVFSIVGLLAAAVLFTVVFWLGLWQGGGLVGSDIYAYYLPQKAHFASCVRAGTLPLWNPLVGFGYPQLAESQTGVFYPPHWLLYPWFSLNTAYSASMLLHYTLAFVFAALLARTSGLSWLGSALAALVYTYGWFPPRICLEWSITGGAWFPLALWCAERFLQTRLWRYPLWLTVVLGVQLLAGHFVLAFVTQLTLVLYVPLRLLWCAPPITAAGQGTSRGVLCGTALALCGGFLLAAVQLLPTWELKQLSQRQEVTAEHDPGYGYIPPRYLTQIVAPWLWYGDESSINSALLPGGSRTNRVEAHLYFGLAPLLLALLGIGHAVRTRERLWLVWGALGLAALVYTTGLLLPVTRHLPGFSFFEGPSRFGVVTTLAAGLLAGRGLMQVLESVPAAARWCRAHLLPARFRRGGDGLSLALRGVLCLIVFGWTTLDLYAVSRQVTYAYVVADPPANRLAESPLGRFFAQQREPVRIFSAAKNLPSLLGVATLPVYLGLGPAQYFDAQYTLPHPWPLEMPPTSDQLAWFHRTGVTHFLSFGPADAEAWGAELVWEGADPFLNQALNRSLSAKFYVYELTGGRGRVEWQGVGGADAAVAIAEYRANRVTLSVETAESGNLLLRDLAYPGWQVSLNGRPAEASISAGLWRICEISHGKYFLNWNYRPGCVYWGLGISGCTALVILAIGHLRFWHPGLFLRSGMSSSKIHQCGPAG